MAARQALRHMLKAEALAALPRRTAALPETIDGQPLLPLPDVCPVTLDELLGE
ncbi:MAG: hypothetical protein QOG73_1295 [Acetobacteraceae bacterium]|jgi:hypothetical protein|nr:hypothetical protein [Acetobacteraceae bacterium]